MSDLKKTFQDMDKTEVGEYRHGRGHFPTEDDGGHANVEVLQALCPNPGATALESVVWAADQIESLEIFRRDAKVENAELHSQIESLQRENEDLRRIASEKHDEVLALEAAAITPEMRESIRRWANTIDAARAMGDATRTAGVHQHRAGEIVDGLRELLGEQG